MAKNKDDAPARRLERLNRLFAVQRQISAEKNIERLAELASRTFSELLNSERSSLFLFDDEHTELKAFFAEGTDKDKIVVPLQMGIIGAAILRRKIINIVNAGHQTYFNNQIDLDLGYRTDSILACPIISQNGKVYGGLELLNKKTGCFLPTDETLINDIARLMAEHIEKKHFNFELAKEKTLLMLEQSDSDRGAVFLLNEPAGKLVAVYAHEADHNRINLDIKLGIAGFTAVTGETMVTENPNSDARFNSSFDKITHFHTRNILCVPLKNSSGETVGVIEAINKKDGSFTQEDRFMAEIIADIVALAVENRMLFNDSERQFHSILAALAASIDARDSLTAGHSLRVAEIATGIARELGYSQEDIDVLRVAAILHDYGKIGVDDSVLRKKGLLSAEEYRHIQTHAGKTFEILDKIYLTRKYRAVPIIASAHHEALDGSGYPRGLHDTDIPYMSKILSVADVYEALTADRHYRLGMSKEVALGILDEGTGRKFDANAVAALKKYLLKEETEETEGTE